MFEVKKQLRWSALKAGVVVTLALLTLFMVVVYAGTIREIFAPSVEFMARFQDVRGLRKGAPVWLFGTEVGSVKDIRLDPVYGTVVSLSVRKSALPFIRSDAEAEILTMGLLGDKYVELTAGSPGAASIQPGELIKGRVPPELSQVVAASTRTIGKTDELIGKVESLITSIAEGKGSFSKLLNDPSLYDNLEKSTAALLSTLRLLEESRGTLRLLIEDRSLYDRSVEAVTDLGQLTTTLKEGKGTLGRLMTDPELYENLNRSARNLEAVLSSINRGEGLAGAVVRNEQLAGEVRETLEEMGALAREMKALLREIKDHPEKYFQFRLF